MELDHEDGSWSSKLTDPTERGLDHNYDDGKMPCSLMGEASDVTTESDLHMLQ